MDICIQLDLGHINSPRSTFENWPLGPSESEKCFSSYFAVIIGDLLCCGLHRNCEDCSACSSSEEF